MSMSKEYTYTMQRCIWYRWICAPVDAMAHQAGMVHCDLVSQGNCWEYCPIFDSRNPYWGSKQVWMVIKLGIVEFTIYIEFVDGFYFSYSNFHSQEVSQCLPLITTVQGIHEFATHANHAHYDLPRRIGFWGNLPETRGFRVLLGSSTSGTQYVTMTSTPKGQRKEATRRGRCSSEGGSAGPQTVCFFQWEGIFSLKMMILAVGGLEHFMFHILGRIIPTDFHIFQRGRSNSKQFSGDLRGFYDGDCAGFPFPFLGEVGVSSAWVNLLEGQGMFSNVSSFSSYSFPMFSIVHWIGYRENLHQKLWFLPSNIGFSCKLPLKLCFCFLKLRKKKAEMPRLTMEC